MSTSRSSQQLNISTGGACMCLCGLKFKPQQEDKCPNHLENWELWLERRRRVHEVLARKLACEPGDLLMNSGDTYRGVKEEKLLLEYTKIETHFDKYRGNPEFWKLPLSLKNRCPPYKGTEYFAVKSKEEKNEIPDIEYVAVPDVILEEKDLIPRTRYLKELWGKSSYRQTTFDELSEKLREVQPHKPDLDKLAIIGTSMLPKKEQSQQTFSKEALLKRKSRSSRSSRRSEQINESVRASSVSSSFSCFSTVFLTPRLSLRINNTEFSEKSNFAYNQNNLSLIFEYFTPSLLPHQQSIVFENNGLATLRIYWSEYKKLRIFREFTETTYIFHPFKFDKNELILLPGMKKEFPIWFQVDKPGNYFEHWEITTLPRIWKNDFRLIILLKGFAFVKHYEQRLKQITEKIRQRTRNTVIKDVLSDIISDGLYTAPGVTHSFVFSEEELFESVNMVQRISMQEPKYIYNPAVITELKQFYEDTKFPEDPEQWNLSIKKLVGMARKKDLFLYFEDRLSLYNTAQLRRKSMKEDVTDTQNKPGQNRAKDLVKKQIGKQKDTLPVLEKTQEQINYYNKLSAILQKLEKPSIYPNRERKKYLFFYIVLSTLFWKALDQLDALTDISVESTRENEEESSMQSQEDKDQKIPEFIPERLIYEKFDECYILRTKIISQSSGEIHAKPKTMLLGGVSASDTKKVFKLYFHKEEANAKGVKDKGQAPEGKKSVGSKEQKNKNHPKKDDDLYLCIDNDFDPFTDAIQLEKCLPREIDTISNFDVNIKKIDPQKYLIFYIALRTAVDILVDSIEESYEKSISSDTLGEIQKCDKARSQILMKEPLKRVSMNSEKSNVTELQKDVTSQLNSEYFEFLQNIHWDTNENTKKYFVGEDKTTVTVKQVKSDFLVDDGEKEVKPVLSNVFSLEDFKRKVEPYCLKDRAAQTDLTQESDFRDSDLDNEANDIISASSEEPKNMFYFLKHLFGEKDSQLTVLTLTTNNY